MQAMVLAAGLGTRLWPLTCDRAKPAVPFLGRPLVAGVIELLGRHGIRRAVVNTHHKPESVEASLDRPVHGGVEIAFSHEPAILGTAGALAQALARRLLDGQERTLVINAKLHTDLDLASALDAHERSGCAVTMVLRPNAQREAFREVLVEGDRVVGFGHGRHPVGPLPFLFTGIHILEPGVLASIPLEPCDTVADIYPPLIRSRRVGAHIEPRGRWWEFSTLERYLELHVRAAEEGIASDVSLSQGAIVEDGAIVRRAVLWENARVEAGAIVEDAVLGRDVAVSPGEAIRHAAIVRAGIVSDSDAARGQRISGDRLLVKLS